MLRASYIIILFGYTKNAATGEETLSIFNEF